MTRVWSSGFGVEGLGIKVRGSGFGVWGYGAGTRDNKGLGSRNSVSERRMQLVRFRL